MAVRDYLFRGLINLPPVTSEVTMQATATHEKMLLPVLMPMVRKTIPRISKYPDNLRRLIFIVHPFDLWLTF
jgi:hypothetical protein